MLVEKKERPEQITVVHNGADVVFARDLDGPYLSGAYLSIDGRIELSDCTDGWYCGFFCADECEYMVESHASFSSAQEAFDTMMANAKRVVGWEPG